MALVTIVVIARDPATAMIEGEIGAGLEIAETATETDGIETGVA